MVTSVAHSIHAIFVTLPTTNYNCSAGGVSRFYGTVEWNKTVEWNSGMVEWWNGGIVECNDQLFMSCGTMLLYYEPASMVVAIR